MNKLIKLTAVAMVTGLISGYAAAQEGPAPVAADKPEFVELADKRSKGIMESLKISDEAQSKRVEQYVENFMITIKNVYEGNEPPKDEAKTAALAKARETLYAGMDAEKLSDDQKLLIKNGLSANHYKINYNAFLDLVPMMKDEEKQQMHDILVQAFDEAIILNVGTEKGKLFEKYRGKVNIYLSKQGYDLKALSVARNERNKKAKEAATQPAK